MKSFLPLFLCLAMAYTPFAGRAQVTRLSNNTNLEPVTSLSSVAILISDADSLWRSDGTETGTFKYATNVAVASSHDGFVFKNKYYFNGINASGEELWVTDGTTGGTALIMNINSGAANSSPQYFYEYNNTLYFFANDGIHGVELWKSDGSGAGTVLLKDINPGTGSSISPNSPVSYFVQNGKLYFTADNGVNGTELWVTDGTEEGTVMVKDINPGANPSNPIMFYQYGSVVLFSVSTGQPVAGLFYDQELWKTDGTEAGTVAVKSFGLSIPGLAISSFVTFNNKVYFYGNTPTNGSELWVTDGTPDNTMLLKDIYAGAQGSFTGFLFPFTYNNEMIFPASSGGTGSELWKTDGTTDGTVLFKDIYPGSNSSNPFIIPYYLFVNPGDPLSSGFFKGIMFMVATTGNNGTELWKSDGTPVGTTIVKDINPGAGSSINLLNSNQRFTFFFTPDHLYFSATEGTAGNELWKSDGTEAGTTRVFDIRAGAGSSNPQFIGVINGIYFFTADDGDNPDGRRDLFRLDGTFVPLPLNLIRFSGALTGRSATLNWTTTGEKNTAVFAIERSYDGSRYAAVGNVPAQKNSADKKNYVFTDGDAWAETGTKVYYRLKMIDQDGKFNYSEVITFSRKNEYKLLVYPNPVKDELRLTINTGDRKQLSLQIFDEGGKQVYQQKLTGNGGNNNYGISVAQWAKGTYYLNVITEDGVETSRFVKQ